MDNISLVLLGALNLPVFLLFCRFVRRVFFRDRQDFWRSLLAWICDPHAFFDKESRRNHLAVLLLSISVSCCVLLVFFEYGIACSFVDALKGCQPFQSLIKL
jgi:hypothetical protein